MSLTKQNAELLRHATERANEKQYLYKDYAARP